MKKIIKIIKIIFYIFPIALLVFVNTFVDAGCYFNDVSEIMGKEIINGKSIRSLSGNENERKIKKYILENTSSVDCVSIGPSLVTYLSKDNINCSSYFNLGVTSGDHYDMMAQFALIDINNIKINKIIFCLDLSYFTDDSYVSNNILHDDLISYSDYMITLLNDNVRKEISDRNKIEWLLNSPLFSISYFQNSIKFLVQNSFDFNRVEIIENGSNKLYYLPDGSRYPSQHMLEATEIDVLKSVEEYDKKQITNISFNETYINNFIHLIKYLKEKNIEIVFWKCPLCPYLWDKIEKNYYNYYYDLEALLDEISFDYSITEIGSFNPYIVGVKNIDYYDARHLKKTSISKYFYFE